MILRVLSMSSDLTSGECTVEFQVIDDSKVLQQVLGQYITTVEGKFVDAADPDLLAALQELLEE